MNRTLSIFLFIFLTPLLLFAQKLPITWTKVAAGVWKAKIGQPQKFDLLGAAGIHPQTKALQSLGEADFPLPEVDCIAELQQGKIYLRFPLEKEEQLFGLGLNFQTVNQRGRILNLHMDHYGGTDNGRTHAPVPFYVSSKGYGVLINSAEYLTVYAGTAVRIDSKHPPKVYNRNTDKDWDAQPYSDEVEILVPANGVEVYVFAGNNAMQAVQRYNLFNGGGVLPPKWGLGFTQRVPTLSTAADVHKEVADFKAHHFPLDFIGLEPGWQTKSYPCSFEWEPSRFSDPAAFIKEMKDSNSIRLNLWLNPYLSPASQHSSALKPYAGSHTVWNGLVPDLNMPQAVQLYKSVFTKQHINPGISGYKIDEVDGYDNWLWPDLASFPSGISAIQMRQRFGLQLQSITASWFKEKNIRTYGLVRGSNAGASSMPYVIYDDYYNHRDFITALCNSSFIGVLWTPEVRSSPTAEEWLRRMQAVCFSPMAMLNAWSDGTKPWTYPEVEQQVTAVANLRMQLLPYIYNAFAQYHFEGKPPVRAMNLADGFNYTGEATSSELNSVTNPYPSAIKQDIKDQFLLGDDLLVAPLFAGDKKRAVILPKGNWYDFYTGAYAGNGEVIEIPATLDHIPLYVRDGAIIPMIPAMERSPRKDQVLPLELRHYGEATGKLSLYDDDGETFDYEKGRYMHYQFIVTKDANGKWQGNTSIDNPQQMPQQYDHFMWTFMGR